MFDDVDDEQEHLAKATERLRAGRKRLAMTLYSIQRQRRTPIQVQAVLDRAASAIRRSELVRARRKFQSAVH